MDDRLTEFAWLFKGETDDYYDGFRAKFLVKYDEINDPRSRAYKYDFEIEDLWYNGRLDPKNEEEEPDVMTPDRRFYNWELLKNRSTKTCLEPGECVFKVGFARYFNTNDTLKEDHEIILG